nr:hypothetical protein [Tanacetum cinerariifolium]
MEAGGKDRPPMLAPGNYVQWKSRIKRCIYTKPNHELIHYCLKNPPYKFTWADKEFLIFEDNDIYSTVAAFPDACEMWKAIERFYKMMNELIRNQCDVTNHQVNVQFLLHLQPKWQRNQCDVTNHQVNVQFLLQLQPEWQRFVTLVKQSQELKTVSYHKLYNILKQHHNEFNKLRAKRIARTANPLGLVAQQQPKPKRAKDAAYHREKMLLCKQEEAGIQLNAEQADWRDDTDNESEDQELEAHYMYMA